MTELFSRISLQEAEELVQEWPPHYWTKKSIKFILDQKRNEAIKAVPLNKPLLESVKKNGFESPFLVLKTWYPICGSQRLRVAKEMPVSWQKKTFVWVCRFTTEVYKPYFRWPDKEQAHASVQAYFQMMEVIFKTLYVPEKDSSGKSMISFEEEGNQLFWPTRDGGKPPGTHGPTPLIGSNPTSFKLNPLANAIRKV